MASITIKGKEFPLPDNFTFQEARKIKAETGLTVGGLSRAFADGDSDVTFALAFIALSRAGDTSINMNDTALADVVVDFVDEKDEGENLPKAQAPGTDDGGSEKPPLSDAETN